MRRHKSILVLALAAAGPGLAQAQVQSGASRGGTLSTYEAGYADGRSMESRTFDPSTRDADGNRLIVNGIIQADASGVTRTQGSAGTGSGADYFSSGASSASTTAVGNLLTVTVAGSWNTVIVNAIQSNTGAVTANGTAAPR